MSLLDWIAPEPLIQLSGQRIKLRSPRGGDYEAWSHLRRQSRAHLEPWEPAWPQDDLSRYGFRRRLSLYARDIELGQGYPFFIFRYSDDQLVGGINLALVRRGASQSAQLGYWLGQPYVGMGYGFAALELVKRYARERLHLHRLEAACLESNAPSRRLLEKSQFTLEGVARSYLKINGVWRDHMIYGLVFEVEALETG